MPAAKGSRSARAGVVAVTVFWFLGLPGAAPALVVPTSCLPDAGGANDAVSQSDVTQYCIDAGDNSPYELNTISNLDITTLSGANTSDVCAMFNTDGDAFADLAICVTVEGSGNQNGNAIVLQDVRLYTCTDQKADRCTGPVLLPGPYSTECEVTQENTDPFPGPAPGPGDQYPADTQILCGIDLDDFGAAGAGALPHDTCAYASDNPNSNPGDCVSFSLCVNDGQCDDANPCTVDTCDATGVCDFVPNPGTPCSDDLFCNGEETCNGLGLCEAGSGVPVDCDDGVSCTLDTCDELADACTNDPMNSLCSDGLFCTGVETCDAQDGCQAGPPPDCDDGVSCTTDTCDEDADTCGHAPNDGACDNGQFCDGVETCNELTGCLAGSPPDCGDGVACTTDTCDESTDACANVPNDGACSNGQFCDGAETCDPSGGCQAGTPPSCDDSIACTADSCDDSVGCVHAPDHGSCDDGAFCDGDELCVVGFGCTGGVARECGDGIACTSDRCNEDTDSCEHAPSDAVCDNGLFCDGEETCDATAGCETGTPPSCDDAVGCTLDSCDEGSDSCEHSPNDASCDNGVFCDGSETCHAVDDCQPGTPPGCDDGIACTTDLCDGTSDSCSHAPVDAACDNGAFCDGEETCIAGLGCAIGVAPECGDGVACTVDSCNEATDECDHAPDHDACDNGAFCDGDEVCDTVGGCQDAANPDCDDAVGCTIDSCDEGSDSCNHAPNDALCDNGLFCDGDETCDAGNGCQDGQAPDCADAAGCTQDDCNETTDSCDHTPDNDACSDDEFCTGVEICDPVEDCEPGADPCPGAFCDEAGDQCTECAVDADCDNGVFCDGVETCVAGTCAAGSAPDCDDSVGCTTDTCDEQADACSNVPSDAACDNGLYCDGSETCDASGGCQPGQAPSCDDGVSCTDDACNEGTDSCDHAPDDDACDNGSFCDGVEACDVGNGCEAGQAPDCDDGIGCTDDSCDEDADSCDHAPDHAACDNGTFCDGAEVCDATSGCEAAPSPASCDDGIPCTDDSCNEGTDSCDHAPDDDACDNGQYCDGVETCSASIGCEAGTAPACDDGVGCTTDSCVEATDSCSFTPDHAACDNGQFCDGEESCDAVDDCQPGQAPSCDDGVSCTDDACNEGTDACDHLADHDACSNDVFCDGAEVCDPVGGCQAPAEPFTCDDGIDCTSDSCDEGADACDHGTNDAVCDNGQFCDGGEVCTAGVGCEAGPTPPCDDGVECTVDSCTEDDDTCAHAPDDGLCANDQYCDGVETCHAVNGCLAGSPVACGDAFVCTTDSCNEATDSCAHDFSTCVCGDSEVTGSEQCDPSAPAGTYEDCNDTVDNDGDGRIDCRDRDCAPDARAEVCDEACSLDLVCARFIRDPATIRYDHEGGPDEIYIHGRIPMRNETLRSSVHAVTFSVSNQYGAIYRASLEEGDLRSGLASRRFRFRDRDAEILGEQSARGGIERLAVRTRRFEGVRYVVFTIRAYGDFSKARHRRMTTELSVGTEKGYLTAEWKATPKGWVLHQRNFDQVLE